ncbi:MAG: alginate export family protein [Halioglobus sp.]
MNKTLIATAVSSALLACTLGQGAQADEAWTDDLNKMVTEGKVNFDFRYRYEFVDQDGISKDAGASTLRSRLTYNSGSLRGFSFITEFDNVSVIGSERYNSTENGKTQYPVVADPKGTDINQAAIKYTAESADGTYGRQRILHSNQRFIGGVAWRQNEQTYDGFRANWKPTDALKLDYSYVYNVNRIFGPDDGANPANLHGENHFVYLDYTFAEKHKFAGFAYLLDFDARGAYASGKTVDNSSDTYGLEYIGDFDILKLRAVYATQSDAGDNTRKYDADYYVVDVSGKLGMVNLNAGLEVLGAGDGVGFATPLATLHKFQGWSDKFLTTPGDGIEDIYVGITAKAGPVKLQAIYHDFSAEDGSDSYGQELDLAATWVVTKGFSTQLKYADYSADKFATDTTKVWLSFQLKI